MENFLDDYPIESQQKLLSISSDVIVNCYGNIYVNGKWYNNINISNYTKDLFYDYN